MMRKWWGRLSFLLIIAVAAGAIYSVWPNQPDRYLPSAIPWPSGQGIPSSVASHLPCHSTQTKQENNPANCRGMTLGLDLKGGSRVTLQAEPGPGLSKADIADGIAANKSIIDGRMNPFGVSESSVQTSGSDKLIVEAARLSAHSCATSHAPPSSCGAKVSSRAAQAGAGSPLALVPDGSKVYYKPGTCEPDIDSKGAVALKDAQGNIAKNPDGTIQRVTPTYTTSAISTPNNIVWTPAMGKLNGTPTIMTGQYLKRNTQVQFDQLSQPILTFNMTSDGAEDLRRYHAPHRRLEQRAAARELPRRRTDPRIRRSGHRPARAERDHRRRGRRRA